MAAALENDDHPPPGVVELREDVPLKSGANEHRGCAGPRLIAAAFAALSAAITLALLTQIYYGDYEVVPHGSVSSSVAACSAGGARTLQAGGGALDAAAAAAFCLAAAAAPQHPTALDASGSLLYWDYRRSHDESPTLAEWGAAGAGAASEGEWEAREGRPPRLVAALAGLHARLGLLPWPRLLQPAIDYVESIAAGDQQPAARAAAQLLRSVQYNSSAELCAAWRCAALVRVAPAAALAAGGWRAFGGSAGDAALRLALADQPDSAGEWARLAEARGVRPAAGSGLAVADPRGAYVALVTGVSANAMAGQAGEQAAGWTRDPPGAPLDLAPALIADQHVCGTRYVIGAGSAGALLATARALVGGATPAAAVEAARADLAPVNVVRQRADALLSHADSRAGGLAARF